MEEYSQAPGGHVDDPRFRVIDKNTSGRFGRYWVWWTERIAGENHLSMTLSVLCQYADREGCCWPRQSTLAERAGLSTRTVRRHIERLEELGIIRVETHRDTDGRTALTYWLSLRPEGVESDIPADTDVRRYISNGDGETRARVRGDESENEQNETEPKNEVHVPTTSDSGEQTIGEAPLRSASLGRGRAGAGARTRGAAKSKEEKQPKPRPRDPVFDAIVAVTGVTSATTGVAVASIWEQEYLDWVETQDGDPPLTLKQFRADPDRTATLARSVHERAARYAQTWGRDRLTPTALAKWWGKFRVAPEGYRPPGMSSDEIREVGRALGMVYGDQHRDA